MKFSTCRPAAMAGLGVILCALAVLPALAVEVAPVQLKLKVADFDPLTEADSLPAELRIQNDPDTGYFVVQFDKPADPGMLRRVRQQGVKTLAYLPDHAYLVKIPSAVSKSAVRQLAGVRWLGAVQPGWKISPELGLREFNDPERRLTDQLQVSFDLFAGEDLDATAAELSALDIEVVSKFGFSDTLRIQAYATKEQAEAAADIPAVAWIEELGELVHRNDTAHWVVQTDVTNSTTIWDRGLRGQGQVIGHIDSRINMNSCHFSDPVNNTPGPGHRKVIAYRSNSGLGNSSHGTHTAATAAGDQLPINGTDARNGHAYEAKISHANSGDVSGFQNSASNLYQYLNFAHDDGARVHTNSWGDDFTTAYTTWPRDIDLFSYDFEDSLVLFAVTNGSLLRNPENAKNVLAVGGSFNGGSNDSFCTGGSGPTADGRRKPEIYAPGCSIVSASTSSCGSSTQSGTSMACPAVTGAGALIRQYFEEGWYPTGAKVPANAVVPTGALIKAALLNSSVDMTNVGGFPSNQEGWGRVLLENVLYFAGDTRQTVVVSDTRNIDGLSTGESSDFSLTVLDSAEPLKVTLVFTEPAASLLSSSPTVNNLDLVVTAPGGATYRGNVFNGGVSNTGGSADPINNVEMVLVPNPPVGQWTVRVEGTGVNQGTQGFAAIATGQVSVSLSGELRYASHVVDDSGALGNGDGILDPGETVEIPVTLRNERTLPATNVSALITKANGGPGFVSNDSADYPDMTPNGTGDSLAPHYRLTVPPDAVCGSTIQMDLSSSHDDGGNLSDFDLRVGNAFVQAASTDTPLNIPFKTAPNVTSTINVTDSFNIADVNVSVELDHQQLGELEIKLTSPGGTTVTLHNFSGAGMADIDTTFDTETAVDGPGSMDDFDGQLSAGVWTLTIRDPFGGAPVTPPGTLQGWSLTFDPGTSAVCNPLNCPSPVPGEIDLFLLLAIEGGNDLRFDWPVEADAASYRLYRSTSPDFSGEELVRTEGTNSLIEVDELDNPTNWYYRVRAVNSCEWEGP